MIKAIVLDRDGTLIEHVPYLSKPSEVKILDGVKEGISKLVQSNIQLFIHTNQSGIAKGFFNLEDAISCNFKMFELLGIESSSFNEICISHQSIEDKSDLRKPSPYFGEMLLKKYKLSSENLCYLGDSFIDLETAFNIGCKGVGVNTGEDDLNNQGNNSFKHQDFPIFEDFSNAVDYLLKY